MMTMMTSPCHVLLPRRRRSAGLVLLVLLSMAMVSVFMLLGNLEPGQGRMPLNADYDFMYYDSGERGVLEGGGNLKERVGERKPQSHYPVGDDVGEKDVVVKKAIFNYNREQIEEQLRRVTERVNRIQEKLPLARQRNNGIDDEEDDDIEDKDDIVDDEEESDETYNNDDYPQNPEFKLEDFENGKNLTFQKPKLDFEEIKNRQENSIDGDGYHDRYEEIYREENRKAKEEEEYDNNYVNDNENTSNQHQTQKQLHNITFKFQRSIKQNSAEEENERPTIKPRQGRQGHQSNSPHLKLAHLNANSDTLRGQSKEVFANPGEKQANLDNVDANKGQGGQLVMRQNMIDRQINDKSKAGNDLDLGNADTSGPCGPEGMCTPGVASRSKGSSAPVPPQRLPTNNAKNDSRNKLWANLGKSAVDKSAALNQAAHLPAKPTSRHPASASDLGNHNSMNNRPGSHVKQLVFQPQVSDNLQRINHLPLNPQQKFKDSTNPQDLAPSVAGQHRIETQIPIQGEVGQVVAEPPATQIQMPEPGDHSVQVRSETGLPLVVDKIYWSQEVEDLVPKGMSDADFEHFLFRVATESVKTMQAAQWNKCGRPKNQFIVLGNNTELCARYRHPHMKLVHGELLSFYLSRMLGLDNVPLVALAQVNSSSPQWLNTAGKIDQAGWQQDVIVALIQWIDDLDHTQGSRVRMPSVILDAYERNTSFNFTHPHISQMSANELSQVLQWSDMIVFDYITGHYDRVASMQDGADREHKPSIMHENIRNLRQSDDTGKLWLIDNESGLLDSYELLYGLPQYRRRKLPSKFFDFHEHMLHSVCLFRSKTIEKVWELARMNSPEEALLEYARKQEALYEKLKAGPEVDLFKEKFKERLKFVLEWASSCAKLT